jgi:hypothetical protein
MISWEEADRAERVGPRERGRHGRHRRSSRPWLAFSLTVSSALRPVAANADTDTRGWLPGNSREIPRTTSASRDAAVSGLVFAPRVAAKGAADFAVSAIEAGPVVLRPGFFAFFELEHAEQGLSGPLPLPGEGKGPMLWRGMFGLSLMLGAPRLARDWLGPGGAIEWGAVIGHESDHVTGGSFDDAPEPGDIPSGGGGNFVSYELAVRAPLLARLDGWWRVEDRAYFAGPILHAPGAEAGLRWHLAPHAEPVVSIFAETLLVNRENGARNGGFLGVLAGLAAPGAAGEILPYTAFDVGNGKGLLINRREAVLSIGVRYAPL